MRLLANENIPRAAVDALRARGHDVGWVRTDRPGASDVEVLSRSIEEKRVLLTFDKDFGELAFRHALPSECGIVLLRLEPSDPLEIARVATEALSSRVDWEGHFSVIEAGRIRVVPLPARGPLPR